MGHSREKMKMEGTEKKLLQFSMHEETRNIRNSVMEKKKWAQKTLIRRNPSNLVTECLLKKKMGSEKITSPPLT